MWKILFLQHEAVLLSIQIQPYILYMVRMYILYKENKRIHKTVICIQYNILQYVTRIQYSHTHSKNGIFNVFFRNVHQQNCSFSAKCECAPAHHRVHVLARLVRTSHVPPGLVGYVAAQPSRHIKYSFIHSWEKRRQ